MTRLVGTWNNKLVIGIYMGGPQRASFWCLLMAYGLMT
jgi:hypothetical protein